jgi:hypothetical protein
LRGGVEVKAQQAPAMKMAEREEQMAHGGANATADGWARHGRGVIGFLV